MKHYNMANSLFFVGRYDEAFQQFSEACVLRPKDADCHYGMANILFNRHQLQDAMEQYRLAGILTDSKDIELSCVITSGKILLELGDYETAEMRFAAALQIDPNNNTALLLRQRAFNQKNSKNR